MCSYRSPNVVGGRNVFARGSACTSAREIPGGRNIGEAQPIPLPDSWDVLVGRRVDDVVHGFLKNRSQFRECLHHGRFYVQIETARFEHVPAGRLQNLRPPIRIEPLNFRLAGRPYAPLTRLQGSVQPKCLRRKLTV